MTISTDPSSAVLLSQAIEAFQAKNYEQSKAYIDQVLTANPNDFEARQLRGLIAHSTGDTPQAIKHLEDLRESYPNSATLHNNLGILYKSARMFAEAEKSFQTSAALSPGNRSALSNLAQLYRDDGHIDPARRVYEKMLDLPEPHDEIFSGLGHCDLVQEKFESALTHYQKALALSPSNPDFRWNVATTYLKMDQIARAKALYQEVARLHPEYFRAYLGLAEIAQAESAFEDAVKYWQAYLKIKPDDPIAVVNQSVCLVRLNQDEEAEKLLSDSLSRLEQSGVLSALAMIYTRTKRHEQALKLLQRAHELDPKDADICRKLGDICKQGRVLSLACQYFTRATELEPDNPNNWRFLASCVDDQGYEKEALSIFHRIITNHPEQDALRIRQAMLLPKIYESKAAVLQWRERFESEIAQLEQYPFKPFDDIHKSVGAVHFYLAYQGYNDKDLQARVGRFFDPLIKRNDPELHVPEPSRKIRVGVISRFLTPTHTIGRLTLGLLDNLDPERFDLIVYRFNAGAFLLDIPEEPVVQRNHIDCKIRSLDLQQNRDDILYHQPDILLYTDIGMDPQTYYLAYSRLAPVQAVMWGHPLTTGIPSIDYFISSELLEVPEAQSHYNEKLVKFSTLPSYYRAPDFQNLPQFDRAHYGMTEEEHIYLCPQSTFKIHPDFDEILAGILREDPKGRVILSNNRFREWNDRLMERFSKTMPDVMDRVSFQGNLEWDAFIGFLRAGDVMLDPLHFGGGNTTYEALSLGTPIVTHPSPFMRSRVTAGCYYKMGVDDLIVDSNQAYIEKALKIAQDRDYRHDLQSRLIEAAPQLYRDDQAVRELENFFESAVQSAMNQAV